MKNERPFGERMETAYQAGREARRLRHGKHTCTHAEGTPAYDQWVEGWQATPVKTLPSKARRVAALALPMGAPA